MGLPTGFHVLNNTPYDIDVYVDEKMYNCLDFEFMDGFLGTTTIRSQWDWKTSIVRMDGHGCNGRDAAFRMRPTFHLDETSFDGPYQCFALTGDGWARPVDSIDDGIVESQRWLNSQKIGSGISDGQISGPFEMKRTITRGPVQLKRSVRYVTHFYHQWHLVRVGHPEWVEWAIELT